MNRKLALMLVALLLSCLPGLSQITTSSMSGTVQDDLGPVNGATVVATHEPTGTKYGVATNAEGRFNINNMRVGGPYTVTVSFVGYKTVTYSDVTLSLGQNYAINVRMSDDTKLLDELVIEAVGSKLPNEKTGTSTNINNAQMLSLPTVGRSIGEMTKLSPYASGMSIAGGDGRSTNFTIDGANFNNNFGLSSALPGGGSPISLDAIEELQVVVAPYDVRQTNFVGGGVNAITKSGSNTFRGSAYTYLYNQDMRGNKVMGVDLGERSKESKNVYGFTFGGPIVKDKLFFFVNAEYEKRPGQVVEWRASDNGVANPDQMISRASKADLDRVSKHLMDVYGYDTGSYTDFPGDESNMKLLARLDWNITDNHSLNFRYNYTKNTAWNPTNGNSTDAGYRNRTMNRISEYGMAYANSIYSMDNIVSTFSGELNSRFTNSLSNQLIATYSQIKDMRGSTSAPFPFIDILPGRQANGTPIIEPYISAGYELFTWNNGVNNNTFTITDNLTYYGGNHKVTAGLSYEYQMADNAYLRNGTGYYRYASVDEFLAQAAPIDVSVTYGYDGEPNPAARVAFNQFGVYAQDEWSITPSFLLTYGIRADYLKYNEDDIMRNNAIYELQYQNGRIDTGKWPTARVQFSPRVGFSWDILGDQSLKLRGGTGLFTGRLPLVFFTNMPTNSGMVQGSGGAVTTYDKALENIKSQDPRLADFAGKMITDPQELARKLGLPMTITPEDGALPRDVNGVDPNFRMPQVWKTSLALDYQIPTVFPFSVTVEGIFNKTINGVMLKNWDLLAPNATWERYAGPDNRYIYPEKFSQFGRNAYMLSNTNEGYGAIANVTVNMEPVKNLKLMASYTYTGSWEISGMPGSNAGSAYSGLISVNGPHLPNLELSQYVIPHKVIANASYSFDITKYNTTHLSLFYLGRPAGNYSFTYSNDFNGDGIGADLIYIPAGPGDVKFVSQADEDAFFAFMEQSPYLKSHKGQYAGAYAVQAPWVHTFDLKFATDFKIKAGRTMNKLTFSLDILNFGNMLNSNWGIPQSYMGISNNGKILKYERTDANNVPYFSFVKKNDQYLTQTFDYSNSYTNAWQLQIGIRYTFN